MVEVEVVVVIYGAVEVEVEAHIMVPTMETCQEVVSIHPLSMEVV